MSNPLHDLFIQAEQPDNHNSLMKILGKLSSRYEFLEKLHEESNRVFTKQKDLASGREVVIVQLTSDSEPELKQFKKEMDLSSRLQHPGIVPVYDAGKNQDKLFFSRKWIDDDSLEKRSLTKEKIWNKEQLVRIFLQLCEALNYAHSLGISHNNLTERKVFISESGNVSITDWSKAKLMDKAGQRNDIQAMGNLLNTLGFLCIDFESLPGGL